MGCVFRHKGRGVWWIKYKGPSGWQYESSHSAKKEIGPSRMRPSRASSETSRSAGNEVRSFASPSYPAVAS